jgi:hypothetical protein
MDVIKKQQHQLDYQNSAIRNLCQGCNDLLLVVTALVDERVGE